MFIEFFCPACQQRLRVPQSSAGAQARCPSCQQINDVPTASVAASTPISRQPSERAVRNENPFATPSRAGGMPASEYDVQTTPGVMPWPSQKIDAMYAFSNAWALFQKNIGLVIGAFAIMTATSYVMQGIQGLVQAGITATVDPESASGQAFVALVLVICVVIQQSVQIFFSIGFVRILLAIARNQSPDMNMLFSGGPWFLRCLGGGILYGLMIFVGCLLLIIPGVYLGLRYWSYMHFIVDRDCTISEGFNLAGEVGNASTNLGDSFVTFAISIGVNVLGFAACCIGVMVSMPITSLAWTLAYLMMTGQPFRQEAIK